MRCTLACLATVLAMALFTTNIHAQSKSRQEVFEEINTRRLELDKLEKEFLEPTEADRNDYAELLSQPHTGLIRLLPREKYDSEVYKNTKTITMRGAGAYYSFTRLTHQYGSGSDISLDSGYLSVGFAGADYGMLINLGDVSLENLSLESPYVATLARYQPAANEPAARIEQRRFGRGTIIEGFNFKNRLPLQVGASYLLRSVYYDESDVLVAFKVVRQDTDGSIIVAWKLMQSYPAPKLAKAN